MGVKESGRAGVREWAALGVLTMPVLLMSIDLTVLSVAIPELSEHLSPTGTELLWIVDIYGFFLAALLVLMGSVGDRIGRRRLLLIGAGAFGAASTLAAFAWSPTVLIIARALLGIGGATLMPSTLALIRNLFVDPDQRRRAVAVWVAAFAGGAGLGPVVGGLLLEHFWWGSVFLINVPVMLILLIATVLLVPEFKAACRGRFDLISAALLVTTLLLAVYALKDAAEHGWGAQHALWFLTSGVLGTVFVLRQQRLAEPLIDVSLFRSLPFSTAVLANLAGVFALTALLYFLPQYLQSVLGKSPLQAGLWALPIAVGAICGSMLAAPLMRLLHAGWLIGGGLVLAALGYITVAQLGLELDSLLAFNGGLLIGTGIGIADTLSNDIIVATAPADRAGAAAGISETAYELGGALGTATLGALGTSLYRQEVTAAIPANTPPDIAQHLTETIGSAVAIAEHMPDREATAILDIVRPAFTDAMTTAFTAASAILAIIGILAATMLVTKHRASRSSEPD
ncbi:MFS transporter [Brevibacterium sp. UMB1308A]|uniref:MFS transporter n=1 Tax=Brevibacterium sp. UMB1308A TaxID=3050608 RepID=UPI00254E37CC|nr:MFS transporter [Brevibacterium sp. UMB1308A]MDK8346781.1 MFS transporter [Brevibacterium sp. UMB1308B]MDK8713950.1 MFS transporter [Brevibacterium sp. UMB1308A]